ncbi:hypothetical protein AKJ45_02060 [candidate division MSBL1 archaeon SCGC-AAA261F19]|uniref:Siroheme decarboxylase AsnC-like ligand binding domain-containing protein n=1 Tax=candidate division MSBL1 archaeon SCGC-AAA261F19 TaxID=1698275 RepID=A0A133V9Y6_9EURY|nr:hypothetical protein AKJ45_02060 [candidate division MSBL1 archaeon SCGC-AAA261F19]
MDVNKNELINRIRRYKEEGYIRTLASKLKSGKIGYSASTLVDVKTKPERIEKAAEIANGHGGVSLNFERSADYNLCLLFMRRMKRA